MDPLKTVEDILGDVVSWATYIVYNMFLVEPNTINVKKVAAYMYGNAVPVTSAINYFNACMELDSSSSYICSAMKNWHSIRDKNPYRPHKAEYSMSSKQWLWINGEALHQHETVWPKITVMQFGIQSTGCPQIIKLAIELIRSMSSNCHAE